MKLLRNIIIVVGLMCSTIGWAQKAFVEQSIDSVAILIGQQTHMTLSVTTKPGARISWPRLKPSKYLIPGIEIVELQKGDSTDADGMIKISRVYTLTSFDEKLYAIPALKVKVDNQSFSGRQLALKVMTVPVDTLHPNQFFPAKDVQDNPFQWEEWHLVFWLSIIVLVLCLLMIYLFVRLKQNKPIVTRIRIVKHVPAHTAIYQGAFWF